MPVWTPDHSPTSYPGKWHTIVTSIGDHTLGRFDSLEQARYAQKRFSSFRASLRNFTQHPTAVAAEAFETRTRLVACDGGNFFQVLATTRPTVSKTLQKALDELG